MQPYFLPYIGYFQLMAAVDKFIILDDANFSKGSWINRNRILSNGKIHWLTIPLRNASSSKRILEIQHQLNDTVVNKLKRIVAGAYHHAPSFEEGYGLFSHVIQPKSDSLSDLVCDSLHALHAVLGISCELAKSSELFSTIKGKGENRILEMCKLQYATTYINAPGGESLYSSNSFANCGIKLEFLQPQLEPYGNAFEPGLSILDVLMNNPLDKVKEMVRNVKTKGGSS